MSFDQFVQQMENIDNLSPGYFSTVFNNAFFAFGACFFFLMIASAIIIFYSSDSLISGNSILRFYQKGFSEKSGNFLFLWIVSIVSFLFIVISMINVGVTLGDNLKPQKEKIYLSYMKDQPSIEQPLEEVIWQTELVNQMSNSYSSKYANDSIDKTSYMYSWAACENCKTQTIYYKVNKNEKNYIKMKVFISFSLADGALAYLNTKTPLRQDVLTYSSSALLNPTVYLPKSDWGFAK